MRGLSRRIYVFNMYNLIINVLDKLDTLGSVKGVVGVFLFLAAYEHYILSPKMHIIFYTQCNLCRREAWNCLALIFRRFMVSVL